MPEYRQSKSKSKSQSQSKSGGRRKKQTKRKLRRGRKSRKVMRGGENKVIESKKLSDMLNQNGLMTFFLERYFIVQGEPRNMPIFDDFVQHYNQRFNQGKPETLGKFETQDLMQYLALKKGMKDYGQKQAQIDNLAIKILYLEFWIVED